MICRIIEFVNILKRSNEFVFNPFAHLMWEIGDNTSVKHNEARIRFDINMARNRRTTRKGKARAGKHVTRKRRQTETEVHNRTLIAILALLFVLHLIDEKTFSAYTGSLNSRRRSSKRKSRKRTKQRRAWFPAMLQENALIWNRHLSLHGSQAWTTLSDCCQCGSGKRPLGFCNECDMSYCSECQFTHKKMTVNRFVEWDKDLKPSVIID